jgi:pilus assembly protein CpaB
MTRRIVAIFVAIVLAALGTAGVLFYAVTADKRARANIDGVTVAIADKPLPLGTSGAQIRAQKLIRLEKLPKESVPSDYLADVGADLDKLVLTSDLAPGQVLLRAMFGAQATVTSGLTLPDGKLAVTVQTGVPEQVAGYVRKGSHVAVFLTYKLVDKNGQETKVQRTRVLLDDVEVLTVGTYQPPSDTTTSNGTATNANGQLLVTLAVDQAQAERVIEGLNTGKLYLGLLNENVDVKPGPGVDNTDTSGGVQPLFP